MAATVPTKGQVNEQEEAREDIREEVRVTKEAKGLKEDTKAIRGVGA